MQLNTLTYFKTGGTCDALLTPASLPALQDALCAVKHAPYFVLGSGTNSLLSDEHWPGTVLAMHAMNNIKHQNTLVTCHAGVENRVFVAYCHAHSLTGAEWMTALPGQIGATVRMNARCYGGEISQLVHSVTTVTHTGRMHIYTKPQEIFRGYKDTLFMYNKEVVATVTLQLHKGDRDKIAAQMIAIESDRMRKGQFLHPSCGCVFKNNYEAGVPSGLLLDAAKVQQLNQKHVFISPQHANFIFNVGGTSTDIIALSLKMREAVYQKFAVWLQYEMEFLGNFPATLRQEITRIKPHDLRNKALLKLKHTWQNKI